MFDSGMRDDVFWQLKAPRLRCSAFFLLCGVLVSHGCWKGAEDKESPDAASDGDVDADSDVDVDVDVDADSDSDADADADGDADADVDSDADGDVDTDADADTDTDSDLAPIPDCYERGGECIGIDNPNAGCPPETYSPFSGWAKECVMDSLRLCCVPLGDHGSPCDSSSECDEGECMIEYNLAPLGGMCWEGCDPDVESLCAEGTVCVRLAISAVWGYCMRPCKGDEWCREGWSCQALPKPVFDENPDTQYVCWGGFPTSMDMVGLQEPCQADFDCLSMNCRDDGSGTKTCTAKCDDDNPCLPGQQCVPSADCGTPGCGFCFQ